LVVTQRAEDTCGARAGCVWASAIVGHCLWTRIFSCWSLCVGSPRVGRQKKFPQSPNPSTPLRLSLSLSMATAKLPAAASGGEYGGVGHGEERGNARILLSPPRVSHSLFLSVTAAATEEELPAAHVRATNGGRPGHIRPSTGTR
jgi:hypothetical protein